ncbi:U3 small nucleolar ribonucleoprotein protein IMP3 [Planococcus citri]|uniref:U3 small nucleolar ribonucleoprotein protein IMP3 n=1 Tax=Planococcus citri TaxID=170843 RepID=UPI0031F7C9C9
MGRKLKYHEQKLLKNVNIYSWKIDNKAYDFRAIKKYVLKNREEYTTYNKLSREIRLVAKKISELDATNPFRNECSARLLKKLYDMGLIPKISNLEDVDRITASTFCRRRLPVIMVAQKMAETIQTASQFIEQGHVRVGPELVKDPAFFVTRNMEDFITWVNTSAIKRHVMEYNNQRDDFEMM